MSWLEKPFKELETVQIYRNDKNLIKSDVQYLINWCSDRIDLPEISELQAILFLHNASYDVNKAKILIEHYFTIKSKNPKLFGSRTLKCPLFKDATECIVMTPLPACTPSGDMIVVGRLMDNDVTKYTGEGHIRLFDVTTLMFLHQNGPVNGLQLVADMTNASFAHVMKYDTETVKTFMDYLQEAMPIRITRIHFINMNYIVSKILILTRPLLPKYIGEAIIVHSTLEQLHAHIPKDLLPEDYGGNSDSLAILQTKVINIIKNNEAFLLFQENQVIDSKV